MIRQSVCGFDEEIMREFNHLAHAEPQNRHPPVLIAQ